MHFDNFIFGRAIPPAAATLQHVYYAADNTTIIDPINAPDIRRQVSFDPPPLLVAQPKQVLAHDPNLLKKRIRIALSEPKN
jgi:hypothetical protein